MNDRLSAFCAGVGAAGVLVMAGRFLGPVAAATVDSLFIAGSVLMIGIGALDWWFDHRGGRRG